MSKIDTKREFLAPEYLLNFQCIGSSCEDTCCAGWNVLIDKDTYQKYKKNTNPKLKELLKENIKRNRSGQNEASYAKIKMDGNMECSFLDENYLCNIHKELGSEFLSNTCAIYPRNFNLVNNMVEKSLTLSCPEAARLALLNEKRMEFIHDIESKDTRGFLKKDNLTNEEKEVFWELRIFLIRVLQNRTLDIEERIILIGIFLKKYNSKEISSIDSVQQLINEFSKQMKSDLLLQSIDKLPTNISFQLSLCQKLIELRASSTITSKRYLECLEEMLKGLNMNNESKEQLERLEVSAIENYQNSYNNYYKPFMEKNEHILENYLVNYVFLNLFPFDRKTVSDSFMMLVLNFSLIKTHIIGMASFHKDLNQEMIVKLVQSFSKTVDHNPSYLNSIEKLVIENGYDSLAHMIVMIKSN